MSKRKTTNKKYVFTLSYKTDSEKKNITDIEEILDTFSYTDETRKIHKCLVSKINFNEPNTGYCCYWCRHPFKTIPLACPIRYIPAMSTRTYYSEMTKNNFAIKELTCIGQKINPDRQDITITDMDYYETDGIFCSPNCLFAYIKDNKKNPMYIDSESLFNKLHQSKIIPAPHWKLLIPYGGSMTIEKFRESFNKVEYINKGRCQPFKSMGSAFEEFIKI